VHRCGFCRFSGGPGLVRYQPPRGSPVCATVGAANLFVPGPDALYMAPSLVAHYVDAHEYSPPQEFIAAVLACPHMRSAEYLRAIHASGGTSLLRPAEAEAGYGVLELVASVVSTCPSCR